MATGGTASATGNITGGNVLTGGLVSATGNLITGANVVATANVIGGNITTGGLISATGNVDAGNLRTGGLVTATGNVTGGNITTGGLITATGNIQGGNLIATTAVITANIIGSADVAITTTANANIYLQPNGTGNIVLANTYINSLASPQQDSDAATKLYVDNLVTTAISYHEGVVAATNTDLATATGGTITYTQPNGVANGIGAKLTTTGSFNLIDTANIQTVGTRVLVKDEGNAVFNGIYTWSNATAIVRSTDADVYGAANANTFSINDYFFVQSGNVNAGSAWIVDAPSGVITFGTSNIQFAQFSSTQVYTANNQAGISLNGTVINAKVDNISTAFDGNGNIVVKTGAQLTTPNIGAATGTSLSTTGNIEGGNLLTSGLISSTGTITGSSLIGSVVTASGNVTGGNILTGGLISATSTITSDTTITGGNLATGGTASATGNITGGNVLTGGLVSATANVTGGNIVTAGVMSSTGNAISGNVLTGGLISAVATITGGNLATGGTASATGNITGGNVLTGGLISATSTITSGANITGANLLTGGLISSTGNILTAGNIGIGGQPDTKLTIYGQGQSTLYSISGNSTTLGTDLHISGVDDTQTRIVQDSFGNTAYSAYTGRSARGSAAVPTQTQSSDVITQFTGRGFSNGSLQFGNVSTGRLDIVAAENFTDTSRATQIEILTTSPGNIAPTVTATFGSTGGFTATGNVTGANVTTGGLVTATGNITGGNLITGGLVSAAGNIIVNTGSFFIGNGSQLTGVTASGVDANNLTGNTLSSNVLFSSLTTVGTLTSLSVSGNTTSGNLATGGLISATGNITGGNVLTGGLISATSTITSSDTITGGNLATGGTASATGNVTGGNVLTGGLISATSTITSAANITGGNVLTGGLISATSTITSADTITGGNLATGGTASATGNITGGNVLTAGEVSATGNVTGNYILGNGAFLSGVITSVANINNGTSNVSIYAANANVAVSVGGTANVAVFATTGEYITGLLSVSGNITGGNISTAGNVAAGGFLSDNFYYANGAPRSFGITYTASTTPPPGPTIGDQWYNTSTDILYEYTYDGTTSYWVDIVSPAFAAGVVANIAISGSMLVNANVTYDIGSSSQGFRTIYANTVSTFGNVVGGNINTAGDMSVGGNLTVTGNAILSGNIVADRVQNGTSQLDIQTANGNANITINGNSNVAVFSEGALTMKGNVLPSANIIYNLGSSTQRWNDLWLANSTIYIGNAQISANATAIVMTNPAGGETVLAGTSGNSELTGAIVSVTGNITGGNIITAGLISIGGASQAASYSASGNIDGGNLRTAGLISATGNITGGSVNAGNITIAADLISSLGDTITIDPYNIGNTGHVIINGNLQVNGTTTTINSNVVSTNDLTVNYANNAINSAAANGGGIEVGPIGGAFITWLYNSTSNVWVSSLGISAVGNITGGNILGGANVNATTHTGTTVSVTGNITGGNVLGGANVNATTHTGATVSVTGNVDAGNLRTGGLVSATGAITGAAITGSSLTVSTGTITGGNIVNANGNGIGNIGSSSLYFNTVFAKATSAQYADLAENYRADAAYEPGTVLEFGGDEEVTISTTDSSKRVAGVVSTNPAYLMNAGLSGTHVASVALTGRVPVKVEGPVAKGDLMVSNGNGRARACVDAVPVVGTIIGKSLENFTGGEGTIEVVIGKQ